MASDKPKKPSPARAAAAKKTAGASPADTANQGAEPRPSPLLSERIGRRADALLDRALQQALAREATAPSPLLQALLAKGITLGSSAKQVFAGCDQTSDLLGLMFKLVRVLEAPVGDRSLGIGMDPQDKALASALFLTALHRYASKTLDASAKHEDSAVAVETYQAMTAEILAAVAHDCGLILRTLQVPVSSSGGASNRTGLYAANAIREHPACELLDEHDAYYAWVEEIDAWCRSLSSGKDLVLHELQAKRAVPAQPRNSRLVGMMLREIESDPNHGVRPVLITQVGSDCNLTRYPALRKRLLDELNVPTAFIRITDPKAIAPAPREAEAAILQLTSQFMEAMFGTPAGSTNRAETGQTPEPSPRQGVFISYAHKDGAEWLDRLNVHLDGLPDSVKVMPWNDTKIKTGDDWFREIEQAMNGASCAVLLLTPGFFASPFIKNVELRTLLNRRRGEQMRVMPLVARPCVWKLHKELNWLQAASATTPLAKLAEADADQALVDFVTEIADLFDASEAPNP